MQQKFELRVIVGGLIWIGLIAAGLLYYKSNSDSKSKIPAQLASYFGQQERLIEIQTMNFQVFGIGDPVFLEANNGVTPIGVVTNFEVAKTNNSQENFKRAYVKKATVKLYGGAPDIVAGDYLSYHSTDESMEWIIRTMFPPSMKKEISELILTAYQSNQADLMEVFQPVVEQSIADATQILREDLKISIEHHRDEIDLLTTRFQSDVLEKEIIPLVQEEIWPIVERESRPLAQEVGQEIWREVSVWRFGWRYLYDRSPLPEKQLSQKEFDRFVNNKAIPIFENHLGDFVELQQTLLSEISKNTKVRETISASVRKISEDEEVRALISKIFQQTIINNDRLKLSLEKNWNSAQAKRAMSLANNRLEPTIRKIGETIFGSPETQITPEFARVLRNRVMHKDERWLTLHTAASENRDESTAANLIAESNHPENVATRNAARESGNSLQMVPVVLSNDQNDIPNFAPELEK
jgi:hypothetical protein